MGRFRPDFSNARHVEPFIDRIKELTTEELNALFNKDDGSKTNVKETENGISLTYQGGKPLDTKEKAIAHFEIDTKENEVVSFECKSWTTTMKLDNKYPIQVINYGVSLLLKKKPKELNFKYKAKPYKIKKKVGKGDLVLPLSDFHIGAYVADLIKTKDFNLDIICGYLEQIAEDVNNDRFKKVHLMLLGDFIESFTGLNHINSWKGLHKDSYGMGAVILAHEILSKHLYSKLHNLESVDFCSGNHDRVTSNNKEDTNGEVAKMLHYLFDKDFKDVESTYSDVIIRRKVNDIGYLATHGHLGLSKKDTGKIVQDYGFIDVNYHVVLQGHNHSRSVMKYFKKLIAKYEDMIVVQHDSLDYRKITVPPLFTGNPYSEGLGYTSTAGFTKLWRNKYGKLNHLDITI